MQGPHPIIFLVLNACANDHRRRQNELKLGKKNNTHYLESLIDNTTRTGQQTVGDPALTLGCSPSGTGHQSGVRGGLYGGTAERLCEKPPPYPGNHYPPAGGVGFHVPQESLYYPATKWRRMQCDQLACLRRGQVMEQNLYGRVIGKPPGCAASSASSCPSYWSRLRSVGLSWARRRIAAWSLCTMPSAGIVSSRRRSVALWFHRRPQSARNLWRGTWCAEKHFRFLGFPAPLNLSGILNTVLAPCRLNLRSQQCLYFRFVCTGGMYCAEFLFH